MSTSWNGALEVRSGGDGAALIADLLALAHGEGLERVTVHSSTEAISVYRRAGFVGSETLLHRPGGGGA